MGGVETSILTYISFRIIWLLFQCRVLRRAPPAVTAGAAVACRLTFQPRRAVPRAALAHGPRGERKETRLINTFTATAADRVYVRTATEGKTFSFFVIFAVRRGSFRASEGKDFSRSGRLISGSYCRVTRRVTCPSTSGYRLWINSAFDTRTQDFFRSVLTLNGWEASC